MPNISFTGTTSAASTFPIDRRGLIQGALYNNAETPVPVRKAVFVRAMPPGSVKGGGTTQTPNDIMATSLPCYPGMPLQVRMKQGGGTLSGSTGDVEYEAHFAYENAEWPGTNFSGVVNYEPKINAFAVANEAMVGDAQSAPQADFGSVINFVFITDGPAIALPFVGSAATLDRLSADLPMLWDEGKGGIKYDATVVTGSVTSPVRSLLYGLGRCTILKRSEYQNIFYPVNIQNRSVYKSTTQGGYGGATTGDATIGDPTVKTLIIIKFN